MIRQWIVKFLGLDVKERQTTVNEVSNDSQIKKLQSEIGELYGEITELHKMLARIERKVYRGKTESWQDTEEVSGNNHQEDLSWLRGIK